MLATPGGQKRSLWPHKSQPDREMPGVRPRGMLLTAWGSPGTQGTGLPEVGLYLAWSSLLPTLPAQEE